MHRYPPLLSVLSGTEYLGEEHAHDMSQHADKTPVERKFGVRFEFPARMALTEEIERTVELNTVEYVVHAYRWDWTGWRADRSTPIMVNYGTSTDKILDRMQLITTVWGSPLRWAYPPRAKLYPKSRKLLFRAKLDWTLVGVTDPATIPATILDITLDGLELWPRGG